MKRHYWMLTIILALTAAGCLSAPKTAGPNNPISPSATPTNVVPPPADTSTVIPTQAPVVSASTSTPSPAFPSATSAAVQPAATSTQSAPSASPASTQPAPTATNPPVTPAPTQVNPPASTQAAPASACTDQASFEADVTIPDDTLFQAGDKFTKTWRLYNSGTCAWGAGYAVVFAYGDQMGAPLSSTIPPAAPGTSIQISLNMTAPASPGQHAGNWQLQNANNQHFGVGINGNDYFWAQIQVSYSATATPATGGGQTPAAPSATPAPGGKKPTPAATPTASTSSGCTYTGNPEYENEILQQINSIRTSNGLDSLTLQSQLSAAAQSYSMDMACKNRTDFIRHTDSNGGRWYQRISAQGYSYSAAFENVFVGNPAYGGNPQEAINWWMNSPIHRANILNPDVTEIGIAYIYTSTSDYGGYYTVDFASPN